jgi:AcrR family transcriptional regulator
VTVVNPGRRAQREAPVPDTPTARRRQAAATEDAFIAAATALFARRGYHGTSIADLAAELGLTTASLYYHVASKQELLMRVLTNGITPYLDRLEAIVAAGEDPRTTLRAAVHNHLSSALHDQDAVAVFHRERRFLEAPHRELHEQRVARYDQLFTGVIAAVLAEGDVPGDPDLLRLAALGLMNWTVEWYEPGGRRSADEVLETFTGLITDRLLGPA